MMAYTKQMADENRAMFERAKEILKAEGWAPETEELDEHGWLADSAVAKRERVVQQLKDDFHDVPVFRIVNQVNRAMARERGRAHANRSK